MELTKEVHNPTMENHGPGSVILGPTSPCHMAIRIRISAEHRRCQASRSPSRRTVALMDDKSLRWCIEHAPSHIHQQTLSICFAIAHTIL